MGISWIDYKGRKILYVDYSSCKNQNETIAMLEDAARMFRSSNGKILSLDNYENGYASSEFMNRAKELSCDFSPKRARGAALGVTGIKKLLLNAYNIFATDKIVPFDTRESALEYLVSD
jgi:hypothetical protein